jgi:hypothetical protein
MRPLRFAVLLGALLHLALFVLIVYKRFRYPYELEWMTGAIADHVERIHKGLPLYAAPSADWIPFLYPPLYYVLGAGLARVLPLFQALRALSIVSTLVTAACTFRLAQSHGATRFWALVSVGLFFACFSLTGFRYDVERCDALAVALLAAGTVALTEARSVAGAALAGALMAAAVFAKQPALLFVLAVALGLAFQRKGAQTAAFAGAAALALVPVAFWLNRRSGGWFWFYVVRMPAAHGIEWRRLYPFLFEDLPRAALLTVGTFAVLPTVFRKPTTFAAVLGAGFFAALWGRLHAGGWPNVLLFWIPFGCVALALLASRVEALLVGQTFARKGATLMAALVLLQLALLGHDPDRSWPDARRAAAAANVKAAVARLEQDGEVLVLGRGHLSAHRHFHAGALVDLLRMGAERMPADLVAGVRDGRFAAIVVDAADELRFPQSSGASADLRPLVAEHYFVAERLDDRDPPPLVGYAARPSWILRRRTTPLAGLDAPALERRQLVEMGLCEARMRAGQAGAAPAAESVEQLAAQRQN